MSKRRSFLISISLLLLTVMLSFTSTINAQTRSRIVGIIKDAQTGEPLFGANVIVKGTYLGAATDPDGKYFIVNVPVGTYNLQISMIGYETKLVTGVLVSADRVATVDVDLKSTAIQGKEVVVTAPRDNLHQEVSNTQMVVTSSEMQQTSGVRQINAFLEKLPGVSEDNGFLTIRGGSADQTGSMVNGFSYNNAAVGNAETSVPLSAIEQVSLLSGGYNAEYGNFRSGLINITTKSGTKDGYHGTFSISKDSPHMRRFGDPFYSDYNSLLNPWLNPNTSFTNPSGTFPGWIALTQNYNSTVTDPTKMATPLDYYLLANWMYMTTPDWNALSKLPSDLQQQIGYNQVTTQQLNTWKQAFANHAMQEGGSDWNFDGGFGGPVPLVSKALGDATFYISNNSMEQHYIMPMTLTSQKSYTTLGTIKATPLQSLTINYNVLWRREIGLSPVRPAFGDAPDASNQGGFMPVNNIAYAYRAQGDGGYNTYWYDAAFYPILDQTTLLNGISVNDVINKSTYWELNLSYLFIGDHTPTGDNRDTTVITQFGPFPVNEMPYGKLQFASNAYKVGGFTYPSNFSFFNTGQRFSGKEGNLYDNSKVHQLSAKFDLSSQVGEHNFLKGGIEYNYIDINHNYWETWNNNAYNTYEFNYHRWPSQTGLFAQDQITYDELVANVGVRFDYYYGGGGLWPNPDSAYSKEFLPPSTPPSSDSLYPLLASGQSALWNSWYAYNATHPGFLSKIKNFFTVSPRIGVSFPVTENSKFYFNYGHFRSNPPYYSMYQLRYRYTKNGVYNMPNPNLEPPRTIQYELGIAYNFYKNYILTISGYSKDVTGEAGTVYYTDASGSVNYQGLANNYYEDIQGLEVNLTKNDNEWYSGWINFNYMLKKTGNTGQEYFTQGQLVVNYNNMYHNFNRSLPQPTINANITFKSPHNWGPSLGGTYPLSDWNISFFGTFRGGQYFDPGDWNPLGLPTGTEEILQWPNYYMVDLKVSKAIKIAGVSTSFFLDINNIFNIKVNQLYQGWGFTSGIDGSSGSDFYNYMASLHLPEYNSPAFDELRSTHPGMFIGGNDKPGDTQSPSKPYIHNPSNTFWIWGQPRDIWFGMRVDL